MAVGRFVIWNELCQSVDSGEEDEGWPSFDAALAACSDGADMPAFHGQRGLVFGRAACDKALTAMRVADRLSAEDSARRAATVASIAASAPPAPTGPSADQRRTNMLAACQQALATELAKRKPDQSEVARLRANVEKLTG
jgi:hypothetical protein